MALSCILALYSYYKILINDIRPIPTKICGRRKGRRERGKKGKEESKVSPTIS